ncbi:hypothetical protein C8F01DRAFT_1252751 [Mycena amicta]|nr:hypothetical protein C8F01DRAFT_1252751 [Mycena amicta]
MSSPSPGPQTPAEDSAEANAKGKCTNRRTPTIDFLFPSARTRRLPPTPEKRRSERAKKRPRPSYLEAADAQATHRAFVNTHGARDPATAANLDLDPTRGRVQRCVLDSVLRADGSPQVMALAANRALDAAVNCEDPLLDDKAPEREDERTALLRQVCLDAALCEIDEHDPTTPYATVVKRRELYDDPSVKPPRLDAVLEPNHFCSLCEKLKSHPVLLMCNHSFCFVCLRVALNTSWVCPRPGCGQVQHRPPLPLPELEAELEATYVGFKDFTKVKLDWSGVRFPPRPAP